MVNRMRPFNVGDILNVYIEGHGWQRGTVNSWAPGICVDMCYGRGWTASVAWFDAEAGRVPTE